MYPPEVRVRGATARVDSADTRAGKSRPDVIDRGRPQINPSSPLGGLREVG